MQGIEKLLGDVSDVVWGAPLLVLLFGTHLYLTFRLRFIQRYIGRAIRLSFERGAEGEGDVSHFGALTTALAATIGTGNIVGVATAVAAGGPGAVLWMWLTGIFGIATKYAEALLSIKYRITTPQGTMAGGPMYVLERGMGSRRFGVVFAALTAIAAFGIGNMVQANAISTMAEATFHFSPWFAGLVLVNSGDWTQGLRGAALTKSAFGDIPIVGPTVLTVGLLTFVFSTILGWSYYGEKAAEYLFGSGVIAPYRVLWVAAVMVGAVTPLPAVWSFADIANGLMAVPNLVSLLVLTHVVVGETREHLWEASE